jgi:hypothetical protein
MMNSCMAERTKMKSEEGNKTLLNDAEWDLRERIVKITYVLTILMYYTLYLHGSNLIGCSCKVCMDIVQLSVTICIVICYYITYTRQLKLFCP